MSEKGNQAVKTVSFMMLITLFGKILGMVREQLLAANYGTDMQAAAFLLASRIPRTFFDVIFASAISASFIPVFVEYLQKKGRQEAFSLANRFITMISTVTLLMMLLGMAFAKPLTLLIAPGYDVETVTLCVGLLRMLFPTMLFTAVAFSFVGILQSLEEFNVPAALSVVSNGVLILYYIFFNEKFGILGLTVAFLIGWAMQAVIQIPSLWKKGYHYHPDFHFKDEGLRKIGKLMLPVMVSTWIQPINFMVNTRFASQLSGGSAVNGELGVSALEYANNLYTIIVGVFVLAIANMVFPKFSRMTEDKKEFGLAVRGTLKSMIFLLIPMTVGLMALAQPVVSLIYQRGAFDETATQLTAAALFFFALGMVGYGVQNILSRAFYANQDGKTPFYSGLISIVINAVLCWLLLKPMGTALLCLQRFRPSDTPKKICCPGADRAKQSLGKLWGQHLSFMFMVRSGVGAEVLHPRVIPGGQQMVAVRLGVFSDQVAILVGQCLPEVQEGAALFQCDGREGVVDLTQALFVEAGGLLAHFGPDGGDGLDVDLRVGQRLRDHVQHQPVVGEEAGIVVVSGEHIGAQQDVERPGLLGGQRLHRDFLFAVGPAAGGVVDDGIGADALIGAEARVGQAGVVQLHPLRQAVAQKTHVRKAAPLHGRAGRLGREAEVHRGHPVVEGLDTEASGRGVTDGVPLAAGQLLLQNGGTLGRIGGWLAVKALPEDAHSGQKHQ